jgi:hypothetical protein
MTTMTEARPVVTGGIDTHLDVHVAAALDRVGGVLGLARFRRRPRATGSCWPGYAATARWSEWGSKAPAATAPRWPAT